MKDKNGVLSEAQGAEDKKEKRKVLTLDEVRKMVKRDLPTVIAFLNAVSDPDVQEQVAVFLHGKYLNSLHKEELDKQLEIKP